jgi:hypothetical protein
MDITSIYSGHAGLALAGRELARLGWWSEVVDGVRIPQKSVCDTPHDKLLDCLINMLCGGRGVVEVNTRVRVDRGLQLAFGRSRCAEQSVISQTLSACTEETVAQMRNVVSRILRSSGKCCSHDYARRMLILDIDMTGMPTGLLAEGASKGYFGSKKNQRGRQLGRVLASDYDESVVDKLYGGGRQLERAWIELLTMSEHVLELDDDADSRKQVLLRFDAGGGTDANINYALQRGYQVITKTHHWGRAKNLCASVRTWMPDPKVANRKVGWVELPHWYKGQTRQLGIRQTNSKGEDKDTVLVFTLSDRQLQELFALDATPDTPWSGLHAYDLRGGGIETSNREDKQGLGLVHRNKRSFSGQEMLILMAQLGHMFIVHLRERLTAIDPRLKAYGIQRIIRDVLQIDGELVFTKERELIVAALNAQHPWATSVQKTFGG